ncbi:MAG: tetratricopeptide repeat protein [Candidatus Peribacteraceae bacterium]|nr:tetratricopeptide repeat protein [Candidatus Peribacteraceae bacterium]
MNSSSNDGVSLSWTTIGITVGIMFAAAFVTFGASVAYGFLDFDDSYLIYGNLAARAPTFEHIHQAFTTYDPELYIPVTLLSYQFNYLVAGLNGGFYHCTNIVLHALNGALVSYLIFLLLGRKRIALACGIFFVIHPLNTEAAVWLSGRKDLLSSTFYLGAMCLYLRYLYAGHRRFWAAALGLFVLGLLSKVSILTLPAAILLLEFLMRERKDWNLRAALDIVPFVALSGVFAVIAAFGKERVIGSSSLMETLLMAPKSTMFYLQKFFIPTDLSPIYPYMKEIVIFSSDFYVPIIILGILSVAALVSLRWTKWIAICFLLFLVTLAPSFLNFHKGTMVFFAVDRYAYLPMIWLMLLLGVGFSELEDRPMHRTARQLLAVVIGIIAATFAMISLSQTKLWISDEVLFTHVLSLYPTSVSARTSLAAVYRNQGRELDEIKVLEEGLKMHKDVAYYTGIGSVAARQGKLDAAETLYGQARILDPSNPEPFFFLGSLEEQRGDPAKAEGYYKEAIRFDPSYVAAYNNLGAIYLDQGKHPEAEEVFRTAVKWNPNFMEGLYNLFQVLEMQKKRDEAFPYLEKAYELNPDNPDILLSIAFRYSERGRKSEAIRALQHLLAIAPSNTAAKRMLQQIDPSTPTVDIQNASERRQERLYERNNP